MTTARQSWPCLSAEQTDRVVEKVRSNVLIFISVLLGAAVVILMALDIYAEGGVVWHNQAVLASLLAGLVYLYRWCRLGRPVRQITQWFIGPLFALAWLLVVLTGGFHSYLFFTTLMYPVIVAAVLGRRESVVAGIINMVLLACTLGLNLTGWIGLASATIDGRQLISFAVGMFIAQSIITFCTANVLVLNERINRALSVEIRRSKRLAKEAQQITKRFEGFTSVSSDWLWEQDASGIYTFVGGRFMATLQREDASMIGRSMFDVVEFDSETREQLRNARSDLASFRNIRGKLKDADGRTYTLEISGRPMFDDDGAFVGMRGVGVDISEKLEAESRISYLAAHDELTGLLNRTSVTERLHSFERSGDPVIMLMVDLDGFKGINDAYGHAAGDAVLKDVAHRLKSELRTSDYVGRLGGDEFVILLPYNADHAGSEAAIERLSQRLIARLSEPFHFEQFELVLSGSIGTAKMPEDAVSAADLFVAADLALYAAKENGRSRSQRFDPELQTSMRRRAALEKDLRRAIKHDMLHVAFQPQYGLDGNTLIGFEALARWDHPEEGAIRPDIFIQVAETCGLISQLERLILRKSCLEAVKWPLSPHNGQPLRLAVNISAVQFNHGCLVDDVSEILAETGLHPSRLELEITESLLMSDTDRAIQTLEDLHGLGVTVAVDDFGTGYSSLSYLQRFPLSRLKIDRSFVKDMCVDGKGTSIANAVVQLGHGLGLIVIAEGVETTDQAALLSTMGCDEVQGYLYSKPVSAAGALNVIIQAHKASGRPFEPMMITSRDNDSGEAVG